VHEAFQPLNRDALAMVAQRFRVLADPVRLMILQELHGGERSVGAMTELLGIAQPSVSKHLKALQEAGFVGRRQAGTVAHYRITDPLVFDLCQTVCQGLRERIEAQGRLLQGPIENRPSG
jgi:DNA-binding transcriptional ArsR family regulator